MKKTFMLLLAAFLVVPAFAADKKNKKKKNEKKESSVWYEAKQPTYAQTDLGRVYGGSFKIKGGLSDRVRKCMAINVGDGKGAGKEATLLFNKEMLGFAAAIPDRPVMYNTYRNGLGGSGHVVGAPYIIQRENKPGWSLDGEFAETRPDKNGAIPGTRFNGHYMHGQRVILSYSVHGTDVLESSWLESSGPVPVLTRTLKLSAVKNELTLSVCTVPGGETVEAEGSLTAIEGKSGLSIMALSGAPKGVSFNVDAKGHVTLTLPPSKTPVQFTLCMWTGAADKKDAANTALMTKREAVDLDIFLKGGPAIWTESIVTKGSLGSSDTAFTVDTIEPPFENPYKALFFFGGHDFFSNGDAAIGTIHGDVWRVSGIDDTLDKVTWKRYATGLFQPLGLKIVEDKVYVLGRDQITRLHDLNGDNEVDYYENFNSDCQIGRHVHEYATCLNTDPAGNFYFIKGINGNQSKHAGTLQKVSADGKTSEVFATGFRWPNGAGVSPDGTVTSADQQGGWVPASRLDIIKKSGFYGHVPSAHREVEPTEYDGPLTWIPHNVDNSCGGQAWVPKGKWGPYGGKMLHLSYGKCLMFVVLQEQVDGVDQAGVYQLPVKFLSGAMRGRFNPKDGHFYVSGLRGWQTSAAKDGCFQRVRYTGKTFAMPVGLNAHQNGMKMTFSEELDQELAEDVSSWNVEQWGYRWTKSYGSKEYKVSNPQEIGHDKVTVKSATLSKDKKSVFLAIDNMQPVMQMSIAFDLETSTGDELIGTVYNTIHKLGPKH